ncbi:MAG: hypothetical protein FWF23_02130 [Alphaproteobacteria bacterium]|nr:hypothetical protein [Alphaproteobacteria bacterium]MCL2504731.1 hypothetical protein [Alphaproteobacteria bacterium]
MSKKFKRSLGTALLSAVFVSCFGGAAAAEYKGIVKTSAELGAPPVVSIQQYDALDIAAGTVNAISGGIDYIVDTTGYESGSSYIPWDGTLRPNPAFQSHRDMDEENTLVKWGRKDTSTDPPNTNSQTNPNMDEENTLVKWGRKDTSTDPKQGNNLLPPDTTVWVDNHGVKHVSQDGKYVCVGNNCSELNPGKKTTGDDAVAYKASMPAEPASAWVNDYTLSNLDDYTRADIRNTWYQELGGNTRQEVPNWFVNNYMRSKEAGNLDTYLAQLKNVDNVNSGAHAMFLYDPVNGQPLSPSENNNGLASKFDEFGNSITPYAGDGSDTPLTWTEENPWCTAFNCLDGFIRGDQGASTQTAHCRDYVDEYFCAAPSGSNVNTKGVNCKCKMEKPKTYNCDNIEPKEEHGPCFFDPVRTQAARVQWLLNCPSNGSMVNMRRYEGIAEYIAPAACGSSTYDLSKDGSISNFERDKDYCVEFCYRLYHERNGACEGAEDQHRDLCPTVGTGGVTGGTEGVGYYDDPYSGAISGDVRASDRAYDDLSKFGYSNYKEGQDSPQLNPYNSNAAAKALDQQRNSYETGTDVPETFYYYDLDGSLRSVVR